MSIVKVRPLGAAIAAAVTTLVPGIASAQTAASASGSTFAEVTREVDIFVSTTVLYDSNIARGRSARTTRGLEKEDTRFTPAAQINLALPVGPAVFSLTGTVGYNLYARNTRLDRETIDLTGSTGVKAGPCTGTVQGRYTRSQSDLLDLSIDLDVDEDTSVNVQKVMRVDGGLSCGAEVGLRPTAFASYRTSDNSAPARRIQDFDNTTYGAGLSYSGPTFGILTAFVGRSEVDYTERDRFTFLTGTPRFEATQYGIRFDRRLGARLQVNGEVSYVDVDLPAGFGSAASFDGVNWNLAATLRVGTNLQLSAGTSRAVDAAGGFNSNLAKTSSYTVRANYAISQPLRLSLMATHRTRDFQVTLLSPALLITDDTFNDLSASLAYQRGRRVSLVLGLSYQKREANIALYDYDSVRGSFGISVRL